MQDIRAISFDCYGTLIDWQTGILRALKPALARASIMMSPDLILHDFALTERKAQKGKYRPYKRILEVVAWEMRERRD